MTKRELVIEAAERLGFTQNEVARIVQATLDAITHSLAKGHRIEIRDFGVFEVKTRDARVGRNPRTGREVPIARKRVTTFRAGKALKESVQDGAGAPDERVRDGVSAPSPVGFPVLPPAASDNGAETHGRF